MIHRITAALAISLISSQAAVAECDEMRAAKPPGRDSTAVAMIIAAGDATTVKGAATVVDLRRRLLVTASHVVPGETVTFRFPQIDGSKVRTGRVVYRIAEAEGKQEVDGTAWSRARDIALIVADAPLPRAIRAAQIRPRSRDDVMLGFYGFPQGYQTPTLATASAAVPQVAPEDGYPPVTPQQARCTRALVADAIPGDSGAAILDPDGYVVGVTFNGVMNGRRNFFVRSGCFFEDVVAAVPDVDDGGAYQMLKDDGIGAIAASLAADGSSTGISSIDFYRASMRFAEDIAEGRTADPQRAMDVLSCPVMYYLHERGLPLERLTTTLTSARSPRDAADRLVAVTSGSATPVGADRERLLAGSAIYRSLISDRLATADTPEAARAAFDPSDAMVLKSYADAQIRLAMNGGDVENHLQQADRAAAVAAILAPSVRQRGAALVTVADAANRRSDPRRAASALAAARTSGVNAGWLASSEHYLHSIIGLPKGASVKPITANELISSR